MNKATNIRCALALITAGIIGAAVTGANLQQKSTIQFFHTGHHHVALKSARVASVEVPRLTVKRTNVGHSMKKQMTAQECGLHVLNAGARERASETRFVIVCG